MRYIRTVLFTGLLFGLIGFIFIPLTLAASGTINDEGVNVRSGPGTNYNVVNTLTKGTGVTILETRSEWQRIQYGSLTGWVSARLINAGSSSSPQQARLRVTGDVVNLRNGPDTSYDKVGQVVQGDMLTVIDAEGNWYRVKTQGGLNAYISNQFVEKDTGTTAQPAPVPAPSVSATPAGKNVQVISGPANIRSGPGSNYDKILMLEEQTICPVLAREGDWYKIRLASGATGYIASWLVKETGAAAPATTSAGSSQSPAQSTVSGASSAKPPVVILDGKTLSFEVPPIIENDRTLVPLRAVFEAMGATVNWNNATRTVTAICPGTTVILALGSTSPTVNGEIRKIDVPAQIVHDRTLVPMRFVAEAFGGTVNWDQASRTITITSPPPPVEEEPAPRPTPQLAENKPGPDVIRLSRIKDETGLRVYMESGAELKGKISEDKGKVRYEFAGRHIEGLFYFEEPIGDNLLKVRGRSEDDKTIVEIELPTGTSYRTASEDGGKKEVFIIMNSILNLERKSFGATGERLIITTTLPVQYTHRQVGDKIEIELANLLRGKAQEQYSFDSSIIKGIQVREDSTQESRVIITINTNDLGKYTTGVSGGANSLNIMLVGKADIKPRRDNLVVLDPGHGGKDTGARGFTLNEKEVNLAVAMKVGELLEQKGIEVQYTRKTDVFVDLEPRANTANQLNSVLFVSIHSNASPDKSKQGTETYYYAPADNPTLFMMQDERKSLATKVQQSLFRKIQRPDRGVKTANFSVLRNTMMPSILIEMAFISNPEEEQLLMADSFRNQAAQGIAEGILNYLKK